MKIENLETHPEKKLSVPDLAAYWSVGESTVYRLTQNGALQCSRIGRRVIVDRDVALRFEHDAGRPSDEHSSGQGKR